MNTIVMEQMAALLSNEAFYNQYKDIVGTDAVVEAIQKEVPDATVEEINVFLDQIAKQLQNEQDELEEAALDQVAGGFAITLTVTGVCAFIKGAALVGTAIGTFAWYVKHRNC